MYTYTRFDPSETITPFDGNGHNPQSKSHFFNSFIGSSHPNNEI